MGYKNPFDKDESLQSRPGSYMIIIEEQVVKLSVGESAKVAYGLKDISYCRVCISKIAKTNNMKFKTVVTKNEDSMDDLWVKRVE
ncbi:hypothetical protein pA_gene0015 [Vibrio phage 13VT501A]|nr:hypothetical protein pA_gene0015 [Vibrio phage 13VT501A]